MFDANELNWDVPAGFYEFVGGPKHGEFIRVGSFPIPPSLWTVVHDIRREYNIVKDCMDITRETFNYAAYYFWRNDIYMRRQLVIYVPAGLTDQQIHDLLETHYNREESLFASRELRG